MLNKQTIDINFSQGLDNKTDDKQLSIGKFESLNNSVFNTIGRLTKRDGYGFLANLDSDSTVLLTTYSNGLMAIGDSLQAYNVSANSWQDKGFLKSLGLDTISAVRTNTNQSQADMALAPNGLACVVFTDNEPSNGGTVASYKYSILNATTGEKIVPPTLIPDGSGNIGYAPRVFIIGNTFVILFVNEITSTQHLQYVTINSINLATSANIDISSQISPRTIGGGFDGVVANNILYIAWNGTDLGGAVRICFITSTLTISTTTVFAGHVADIITVAVDTSTSVPVVYVPFVEGVAQWYFAVQQTGSSFTTILAPTLMGGGETVVNLTAAAKDGYCTMFFELLNAYTYDSSILTNYVYSKTGSQTGSVPPRTELGRGIGLASKAITIDSVDYVLCSYDSDYQPSYFLIDGTGNIVGKLAYSNGGGYLPFGLPSATLSGSNLYIPYLFKNLISPVNRTQGVANSTGTYSQAGINIANYSFDGPTPTTNDIGANLNVSGGLLWSYDGVKPIEQGFNLWPDYVEVDDKSSLTPTGDTTITSNIIHNVSVTTNIVVGMNVTGAGIPASTTVTAIDGTDITISNNATATAAGVTLTFTGNVTNQIYFYQAIYQWTDAQGNIHRSAPSIPSTVTTAASGKFTAVNVPTLRVTYKIDSPVQIVIYRWSTAQQSYYQVTSILAPILNDTTVDSITFIDTKSDAEILGNSLIYTTGGLLENIGPPATEVMTLWQSRLFLVDSEDKNLIWFSKQIVESTPVEFSDLLTLYVAPTIAAQGSTGPIRVLAAMDDKLIIFKKDAIYYVTGSGPDNAGANNQYSDPIFITATVGCDNPQSIAFSPSGLMFQSDKGIWLLGRDLSTTYIGSAVSSFNEFRVLSAVNVPAQNQIRFTLSNDVTLEYDYFVQQWGTFTGIKARSSTIFQSLHTYVDPYGRVLQQTPSTYLDGSQPTLLSFTTGWINLAGVQGYERFYFLHLLGEYKSPFKLNVSFAYDYNPTPVHSVIVTQDNTSAKYGVDPIYGSGSPYGGNPTAFKARIFPNKQKCESFQITIQEVYDPSYGVPAGEGLTLSGLNLEIGVKKGYRTSSAKRSFG